MSDQEFLHGAIHGSLLTVISKPHRGYWALLAAAWAKTPPSWRAVYAAALRGNERDDAARDIIATIPMDKLPSEERALIEAK